MEVDLCILVFLISVELTLVESASKKPVPYTIGKIGPQFDNPGFIRDRIKENKSAGREFHSLAVRIKNDDAKRFVPFLSASIWEIPEIPLHRSTMRIITCQLILSQDCEEKYMDSITVSLFQSVYNSFHSKPRRAFSKPDMPEWWANRHKHPYNPGWMDYCDPYHCNDYHKTVCGLNRHEMRFKWFQSVCHLALHNQCSVYRGAIKYDLVETKFCQAYVMHLRSSCPSSCEDEKKAPVCGVSVSDRHVVMFNNKCAMDKANCNMESLDDYEEVVMSLCTFYELYKIAGYT